MTGLGIKVPGRGHAFDGSRGRGCPRTPRGASRSLRDRRRAGSLVRHEVVRGEVGCPVMAKASSDETRDGVALTHLDQPVFEDARATKRELVDYLDRVSDKI